MLCVSSPNWHHSTEDRSQFHPTDCSPCNTPRKQKTKTATATTMSCTSFEITAHHSRHSSFSSLGEDSSLCERRSSFCSTPSNSESFSSPAIAILASSSPEIRALCKVPHVLTFGAENSSNTNSSATLEFPVVATPSPPTTKKQVHDETNSTTIASSSASWEGNEPLEHLPIFTDHFPTENSSPLIRPMTEDALLAWQAGGNHSSVSPPAVALTPKVRRISLSPDSPQDDEDLAFHLASISLHDRTRCRRQSLHRRVSHDMLPSPDQIAAISNNGNSVYPPPRYPSLQRGASCPNVAVTRRRRHRRNTTQIVLPPK